MKISRECARLAGLRRSLNRGCRACDRFERDAHASRRSGDDAHQRFDLPRRRNRPPLARTRRALPREDASGAATAATQPESSRSGRGSHARTQRRRPGDSPFGLGNTRAAIRGSRHHEQQIGQAVEIHDDDGLDSVGTKTNDTPLGAPADRSAHVQQRTRRRAAGEDEFPQRLQFVLEPIDELFESLQRLIRPPRLLSRARRSASTDRPAARRPRRVPSEWSRAQPARSASRPAARAAPSAGIQLVHLAVRVNPGVRLRDARLVEERRFAGIPGLCVDLHSSTPLAFRPRSTRP